MTKEAKAAVILASKEYWQADHDLLEEEARVEASLTQETLTREARAELHERVTKAYLRVTNRLADLRQAELDLRLADLRQAIGEPK